MTWRELDFMDRAKRSAEWLLMSDLMSLIANANAARGKTYRPEQFNRYPEEKTGKASRRSVKPSELERF